MFKILEERDVKIAELETSLQKTRESLEKLFVEKEMKMTTAEAPITLYKCSVCGYQAKSSSGLRMHMNRKHTKYEENMKSFQCENCGKEFRSAEDFKEHMVTHSYQKLQYKCDECDFWGPNEHTMKMHTKRIHSETITCGMCDFETKQIECLDTHTFTCEMYTCNECFPKQSFSTLDDIGMHMRNEHGAYGSLSHFKRQLNNQEFFDETIHFASDLFRNKK